MQAPMRKKPMGVGGALGNIKNMDPRMLQMLMEAMMKSKGGRPPMPPMQAGGGMPPMPMGGGR